MSAASFSLAQWISFAQADPSGLRPWSEGRLSSFELPILSNEKSSQPRQTVSLADARGHVTVVHFFATWCEPCRKELPALERLSARANGAIKVYVISVDEPELRLRRFAAMQSLNLPILIDTDGALAKSWTVVSLPTTFLLDADHEPRFIARADQDWDEIDPVTLLSPGTKKIADSLNSKTSPSNQAYEAPKP